jgi:hypothetical protein
MQQSMVRKRASSAALSAACWNTTVMVRAKTVSTCPAAATGSAMAIPVAMLCWPTITRMAEIMLASAESGDCAAPTFIQPSAISSSVPPSIIPVFKSPRIKPITVQAINGRCV